MVIERMVAEGAQLLRAIEVQIVKPANGNTKSQSSQPGIRYLPAWHALVGASVSAIALTAALVVGSGYGAEHETNATVGRAFSRAFQRWIPSSRSSCSSIFRKASR